MATSSGELGLRAFLDRVARQTEAALRPNLRVVQEKTQDQIDLQALHRVRRLGSRGRGRCGLKRKVGDISPTRLIPGATPHKSLGVA